MRYALLGQTGLRVSELFLGAMNFGAWVPVEECRRMLDRYADEGGNVLDTAVNYGGGESETALGELLAGRRDRFVLATKYSCSVDVTDLNAAGNHRKNLIRSLETSLRRLRTDHIDLYWAHFWDRHTPIEETMRALDDCVRAGKIRYVGMSDAPAWLVSRANTLAEWRGWTPFAAVQVPYNLLHRDVERDVLPMADALGLSVATWGPLARGALGRVPSAELSTRNKRVVAEVRAVAEEVGATPAQVAIAWTRAVHRTVHPIIGASSEAQLADNLGAAHVDLPEEAVHRLAESTGFERGFFADFLADSEWSPQVFGEHLDRLDGR